MSSTPPPVAAGHVLAAKYRLESMLGRGGMGSVWRAEHLGLRAPVAVKLMNPLIASSPEALGRFHREAHAAAALRSQHVVQVLDYGIDEPTQTPFIVMELLEGESLAGRLQRVGRLSVEGVARIIPQVCRALTRAHELGIVHRDLKPDNIFLVREDDHEIAKVLDFGIAKAQATALAIDSTTQTGTMLGTPYYMSPEQIRGSKDVTFRSDLWAVGVITCECLTGRRVFGPNTVGELALAICVHPLPVPSTQGAVPPGFDAWFERALAREPEDRFPSARALADELVRVCQESSAWVGQRASQAEFAPSGRSSGADGLVPPSAVLAASAPVRSTDTANPLSNTSPSVPLNDARLGVWLKWGAGAAVVLASAIVVVLMTRRPSNVDRASEKPSTAAEAPKLSVTPPAPSAPVRTATEKKEAAPVANASATSTSASDAGVEPQVAPAASAAKTAAEATPAPRRPPRTSSGAPRKGTEAADKPFSARGVLDQRR